MAVLAPTPPKRIWEQAPTWLPLGIVLFSLIAFGVRADSQIRDVQQKVISYDKLVIERADRMARVETKLENLQEGQARIEALLTEERNRDR